MLTTQKFKEIELGDKTYHIKLETYPDLQKGHYTFEYKLYDASQLDDPGHDGYEIKLEYQDTHFNGFKLKGFLVNNLQRGYAGQGHLGSNSNQDFEADILPAMRDKDFPQEVIDFVKEQHELYTSDKPLSKVHTWEAE